VNTVRACVVTAAVVLLVAPWLLKAMLVYLLWVFGL
jgi:hypothetical protein